MSSVVWILGAGFSKPLGGPLLHEFFMPALNSRIRAWHDVVDVNRTENRDCHDWFRRIGHLLQGLTGDRRDETRPVPWTDAEELLEYVDVACRTEDNAGRQNARAVLKAFMSHSGIDHSDEEKAFANLALRTRQHLAMACEMFVPAVEVIGDLEKWEPYTRWASKLEPLDNVLTFNYDRVTEMVLRLDPLALQGKKPTYTESMLFKLHGSTDWIREGDLINRVDRAVAFDRAMDLVMGTPGPTKKAVTSSLLKPFWEIGRGCLQRAEAVVFVGYRFPESDAQAKQALLGALRSNGSKHLHIHIVLGPERNADVARLEGMLTWALGTREVHVNGQVKGQVGNTSRAFIHFQPMRSQDFFAVFERNGLFAA